MGVRGSRKRTLQQDQKLALSTTYTEFQLI